MTETRHDEASPAPGALPEPVRLSGGVTLVEWQEKAVHQWIAGDDQGAFRSTLEIFTGGGKTLIALAAFAKVSAIDSNTRLAIVVPSEALARQWVAILLRETTLAKSDIGLVGAGSRDSFEGKRALVTVLNSAARKASRHRSQQVADDARAG
jgi:superfamily II DNA or RNA helicase